MPRRQRTNPAAEEAREARILRVAELRRNGHTYREIGEIVGVSHEQARRDWYVPLTRMQERADGFVRDWRTELVHERAELRAAAWAAMEQCPVDRIAPLMQALLKSHEVDAKMLGLNEPEAVRLATSVTMSEEEARAILDEAGEDPDAV